MSKIGYGVMILGLIFVSVLAAGFVGKKKQSNLS